MADRTAGEAYEIILDHLREIGLSWVVAQIQEQIRSGKSVTKAVTTYTNRAAVVFAEEPLAGSNKSRRRETLAATEEYTEDERLEIALQAVERALVHSAAMEKELVSFYRSSPDSPSKVSFEPAEFDESERLVVEIIPDDRRSAIEKLESVLSKLRSEIRDGDQ